MKKFSFSLTKGILLGFTSVAAVSACVIAANVNNSLVDGWETASDFFERIQSGIGDLCYGLYDEMNNYVEETKLLELQAQTAVEKANETAKNILDDLNLNGDLQFYSYVNKMKS